MIPLAAAFGLAACDAARPTDPLTDDATLAQVDEIALDVLEDAASTDVALDVADVPVTVGQRRGMAHGRFADAQGDLTRARLLFQQARAAVAAGDRVRAADHAREARALLAGAVFAAGGARGAMALVRRAEALSDEVGADPSAYDDAATLQGELGMLAGQVRARLQAGDSLGAVARAILAEQRHRHRHRRPGTWPDGAEIYVQLGATAVSMATRLLDEQTPSEEQLRFLDEAETYQRAAEAALEEGSYARAAHLADLAIWTSLQAVVLPDVTVEEARAMLELAKARYEAALATAPEGVEATLLERARLLLEKGEAMLEAWAPRGIGALWRSAVVSTWVIG
jgi:tetratricopeptide (TPR) repeat protein